MKNVGANNRLIIERSGEIEEFELRFLSEVLRCSFPRFVWHLATASRFQALLCYRRRTAQWGAYSRFPNLGGPAERRRKKR